jgi:ribosomal protein L29
MGAGPKGHWQLTKIEIASLVGYKVSSQVFVEKPFSKELCKHFDDTNDKLEKLKNKKFESTGFRNQNKEDIADDLSLLRKEYTKLEMSKTKDLLDKSLKVIPIEVLKRLGLYNGPKSVT